MRKMVFPPFYGVFSGRKREEKRKKLWQLVHCLIPLTHFWLPVTQNHYCQNITIWSKDIDYDTDLKFKILLLAPILWNNTDLYTLYAPPCELRCTRDWNTNWLCEGARHPISSLWQDPQYLLGQLSSCREAWGILQCKKLLLDISKNLNADSLLHHQISTNLSVK